jgi:DNA-directed RNA polymerase specialized sigma24 family protein
VSYKALCEEIDALHASGDGEQLYESVRLLAYHRLRDDDASQEVAIEAWTNRNGFRGSAPYHAWINGIINHKEARLTRSVIAARQHEQLTDAFYSGGTLDGPEIHFPSATARCVFELKAEGFSVRDIAVMLGMTRNALDQQCHRWKSQISLASA